MTTVVKHDAETYTGENVTNGGLANSVDNPYITKATGVGLSIQQD